MDGANLQTRRATPGMKQKETIMGEILVLHYDRARHGHWVYDHRWWARPLGPDAASWGYHAFIRAWGWLLKPLGMTAPLHDEADNDRLDVPFARAEVEDSPELRRDWLIRLAEKHNLTVIQEFDKTETHGKGRNEFTERKVRLWVGRPEDFPAWLKEKGKVLTKRLAA